MRTAAIAFAALLAGCATVNRSSIYNGVNVEYGQTPIETVEIENSAWLLFKCIPIASGEVKRPNENSCRWFENTVSLQSNLEMLDHEMKLKHATRIANLTSHSSEETFLFILFARQGYHTSAVLLGPETCSFEPTVKHQASSTKH